MYVRAGDVVDDNVDGGAFAGRGGAGEGASVSGVGVVDTKHNTFLEQTTPHAFNKKDRT